MPQFFSLVIGERVGAYRLVRVHQDLTLDLPGWLQNQNSINQIIFPMPPSAYYELADSFNSSILYSFIERVLLKPGTVTTIPSPVINSMGLSGLIISTRMGNVGGITGYYLYRPPRINYADGDEMYVPEAVVQLMPRRRDGTIEYSFYASEEYCLIQTATIDL